MTAITSGGSQAVFWKINTLGESAFLDTVRDAIMPINRKWNIGKLLAAIRAYPLEHRRRVTFEYVLLDGVNDSAAQARELLALTREVPCKFNLIPFNPFPGSPYRRPSASNIRRFAEILLAAGVVATTRKTRGDDIDAACGQLAGQVQDKTRRTASRTVHFHEVRS